MYINFVCLWTRCITVRLLENDILLSPLVLVKVRGLHGGVRPMAPSQGEPHRCNGSVVANHHVGPRRRIQIKLRARERALLTIVRFHLLGA
jgi:hypothetical protein